MIEKNEAVDFIGEVAIVAGMEKTSVTIETLTECVAFMISRADFEMWLSKDMHFLRLIAKEIAFKLYRDMEQWHTLVNLNHLEYPYIVDTPQEKMGNPEHLLISLYSSEHLRYQK